MSNIYCVGLEGQDGPVKVGMTTRSVFKRIGDWDTGTPWKHEVLFDLQVFDGGKLRAIEHGIHKRLAEQQMRLEWFDTTMDAVLTAVIDALLENDVSPFSEVKLHNSHVEWGVHWSDLLFTYMKAGVTQAA